MNRAEFKVAYREARKVFGLQYAFFSRTCVCVSLFDGVPLVAISAASRCGDPLRFSYLRRPRGGFFPKLSRCDCRPVRLPGVRS
jgi:hypothetical protein